MNLSKKDGNDDLAKIAVIIKLETVLPARATELYCGSRLH